MTLRAWLLGVAGAATVALVTGMLAGGSAFGVRIAGLADAGAVTRWGLPFSRLAADLAAVATVGLLLMAAVLLPSAKGVLSPEAGGYARLASRSALAWAVSTAVTTVFTVSDILAVPLPRLTGALMLDFVTTIPQGGTLLAVLVLALVVAGAARGAVSASGALGALGLALLALLPPVLTGHSATSPNHSMAITGLGLHLVTLALWAGGLAAVTLHAARDRAARNGAGRPEAAHGQLVQSHAVQGRAVRSHAAAGRAGLEVVAGRFSRVAGWCLAGVAVSGVAGAAARLTEAGQLVTSAYGWLVLAKAGALALLAGAGLVHRRRTLAALRSGRPGAFARLAAGEVVIMAAAMGLAVALSRTSPPLPAAPPDPVRDLLGYAMPPELTAERLATLWRLDLFFALVVLAAAGGYAAAVVRLRRRGDAWPLGRSISWAIGVLLLLVFTQSGLATYAPVLFSVHMIQHMGLAMLAPIFLVLGAPVTLALRAVRPAVRRGDRGPREWIVAALHSRAAEIVSHPVPAMVIFISGSYALYYTPLFETAMRQPVGHILMNAHFLLSGALFFWVVIGVDPAPRRLPYVAKLGTLMMTMPFHAFFGISMMMMGKSVASSWYEQLARPWGSDVLVDQNVAGGMAWAFGEIPTMIVVVTIAAQWALSDHRQARRLDRDRRGDGELAAYNDYLARLHQQSGTGKIAGNARVVE
ncbi:cytochrome c oxidase assembly protein [Nonomuraea typhae]|uniref:cytochrome c oxidase assembly protein n=1 Tax=Nonomuraea typhae TaxID=2603600 RepID=UPI0012FC0342|nr:cytochrome c oxidase assembly protein [Nonomuraea typhae]